MQKISSLTLILSNSFKEEGESPHQEVMEILLRGEIFYMVMEI